ncbi:MAG: NADH-ubiquinone oxidoreductase-F iron-sulfur binding region domain-containing protein [Candidatus Nanopelagicales bacterium]
MKIFVPADSSAKSVGSDSVARILGAATPQAHMVRNGSRGMYWLEPLVEVETDQGRVAYGPIYPADADSLAVALNGNGEHPKFLGVTSELPWIREQTRLTFERVGIIDPLDPVDFAAHGGLAGLQQALVKTSESIIDEVMASGLRGRGGAGFPAAIKWRTVAQAQSDIKYICINADEGDSGTFADRVLMEGDPFTLIEGMAISAIATGATHGYIYIRSEYPDAIAVMNAALDIAREHTWIGPAILGSHHAFEITVRVGAGSYVCGEETAMLESLEGKRGMVRPKPPIPALSGLFGKPTVINNVMTIAAVPYILAHGGDSYAAIGTGKSTGTSVYQLAGNIAQGGIVELGFGVSLRHLVEHFGAGTRSGAPLRAVQVGGPLGAYLSAGQLDVAMDYESLTAIDAMLGHGGIVVFDETVNMAQQARFAMEFCAEESCGKCTPCRIGSIRGVEVIDLMIRGENRDDNRELLVDLCEVMTDGSLCAMGGLTPMPVLSALNKFPEDFGLTQERTRP